MFKISFRISPFQEFNIGSLVTYRDENLVDYIKDTLYSRSNFFYIESVNWDKYECKISNGIDSVLSTPDQLIEVVSYIEKIDDSGIKSMHFSSNTVENVAKWQNDFDNRESYILENQRIAIFLENVSIPRNYFSLESRIININSAIKNYTVARFDDEVIQDLL
jgi:hypothetical protein